MRSPERARFGGAPGRPRASPGAQAHSRKISAPSPIAIAPYCTARTTANAVEVTGPASLPCSSSSTVFAGALASPTVNTKPPDTGCESAEMTR